MQTLKWLVLLLTFCAQSLYAYNPKEGNVQAMIGPFASQTNFTTSSPNIKPSTMGGVGLIINGDINDRAALEIALFDMNKIFYKEEGPYTVTEQTNLIHTTMGYRQWINPYLSASIAFYSAYPLGEVSTVYSNVPAGRVIQTSARDVTEYGFDFSLQGELWQSGRYTLILDTRYALTITNQNNEKSDHYGALLAIRYFIQDKQIKEGPNPNAPKTN